MFPVSGRQQFSGQHVVHRNISAGTWVATLSSRNYGGPRDRGPGHAWRPVTGAPAFRSAPACPAADCRPCPWYLSRLCTAYIRMYGTECCSCAGQLAGCAGRLSVKAAAGGGRVPVAASLRPLQSPRCASTAHQYDSEERWEKVTAARVQQKTRAYTGSAKPTLPGLSPASNYFKQLYDIQ